MSMKDLEKVKQHGLPLQRQGCHHLQLQGGR